jgi:hypothetical protein
VADTEEHRTFAAAAAVVLEGAVRDTWDTSPIVVVVVEVEVRCRIVAEAVHLPTEVAEHLMTRHNFAVAAEVLTVVVGGMKVEVDTSAVRLEAEAGH